MGLSHNTETQVIALNVHNRINIHFKSIYMFILLWKDMKQNGLSLGGIINYINFIPFLVLYNKCVLFSNQNNQ